MADQETILSLVQELAQELLQHLGAKAQLTVNPDPTNQAIKVEIETDQPGSLIGFHGKTLSAFQLLLGLMVYRRLNQWQRLIVDVNGYRQEQQERLRQIALNAAQRVKFSGRPVVLSPMTPFERRIIHLTLTDFPGVTTRSQGEGDQRRVVIEPERESGSDQPTPTKE